MSMLKPWHRYFLHAVAVTDEGQGLADVINARPQGFILRRSANQAAYFYENRLKFSLLVHLYVRPVSDREWAETNS